MPKLKGIYLNLPRIVYGDAVEKILFGYVMGFRNRNILGVLEITEACRQFIIDFELSEEEWSEDICKQSFYRMYHRNSEFVKYNRKQNGECNKKGINC